MDARFGLSCTWQDQAVLGHLPQAAGLGPLLGVSSVYCTAPVYPAAGIQLLPCLQGLILSRVGRRRKEAMKCEACPETGYMDTTPVPAHFRHVVEAEELFGQLPMRSPPYPHKVFRDKERARAMEEQTSKSQECRVRPASSRPAGSDPVLSATGTAAEQTSTPALPQLQIGHKVYCHPLETRGLLQPLPRLRKAWINQCFHFVLAPQLPAPPQNRGDLSSQPF